MCTGSNITGQMDMTGGNISGDIYCTGSITGATINGAVINGGTINGATINFGTGGMNGSLYSTGALLRLNGGNNDIVVSGSNVVALEGYDIIIRGTYVTVTSSQLIVPAVSTSSSPNTYIDSSGVICKTSSSRRFKKNIEDIGRSSIDIVDIVRPVQFESAINNDGKKYYGMIAEEVYEIAPELVDYYYDADEKLHIENVHYTQFIPLLIAKIKELQDRISDLDYRGQDE